MKNVKGDILEVAVGSGLQQKYYDWNTITSYIGIDLSDEMMSIAGTRIPESNRLSSSFKTMDAKSLEFPDNTFDSVIDTFSLCVIDDPQQAVKEMTRVVKPKTGRIILLENTLSDNTILGAFQQLTEPIITPFSKGCRWDVNVPQIAKSNGLKLVEPSISTALGTLRLDVYSK